MPEFTADDNKEIGRQAFDTLLISRYWDVMDG